MHDLKFGKHIKRFYEGTVSASNIASIEGRNYSHGALHLLLKAIVVQAWTGFEKLAGKLANEVRSAHPECFAHKGFSPEKYFNVKRMESLNKSFKEIYDDPSIDAVIGSVEVKSLAVLRHLFAHQNGVVDQKHIDQRNQPPIVACFDGFPLHSEILLDGPLVRSLVDPVTTRSFALISAVDAWMESHKPTT